MFSNNNSCYSLSDVAAVTGNNRSNGMFGDEGGAWWIIILFLFCFAGWNGNGGGLFGGYGGSTASGITDGYVLTSDFANIERKIDGVNNGLCDGFYTNAQLINGVNSNINTASQGITAAINNDTIANMQNTNAIGAQITALGTQMASCCCEAKTIAQQNASDLNYRLAEQSCQTRQAINDASQAITLNQDANTRSILAAIQNMQTQALQDKIAELTAMNSDLRFQASQAAQNSYLINALNPAPVPAYTVPSPYQAQCGCRTGCGTC